MELNIMDFFKLPTKIMVAIALATGMILFLPDTLISKMYLDGFRNEYGFIIGAAFVVSVSILTIGVIISIYNYFYEMHTQKKVKENSGKLIASLDDYKKTIVYLLYNEDNHTHELPLNDGAVVFLENMMVIGKATNQYFVDDITNPMFPYLLQPWVIEKLQSDEELLASFERAAEKQMMKMGQQNQYARNNYF